MRSYWTVIYLLFYVFVTLTIIYFSGDMTKSLISMMNIVIVLIPLVASIFGAIYCYDSREFTELLLSQPIKRKSIFLGQYLGLGLSLCLSFVIGVGLPFMINGIFFTEHFSSFIILMGVGAALSFVFSAFSYWIALLYENKIKGFGFTLFLWLFAAIIYDGVILLFLIWFKDYPTENLAICMSLFNPIDLSRISVMLGLDISALMGYTGAVFFKFFGSFKGIVISIMSLLIWIFIPIFYMLKYARKKDF